VNVAQFWEKEISVQEPKIHSHITDCLPDQHPMANEQVVCRKCGVLVHAFNNECMQTWVETGRGALCIKCFATTCGEVLEDGDGLSA
jgi:hypothetical protein